ncbi:flagellar biosynthesis protein FlhB [Desulfovibrio sp. OttesenSCG-928-I05]|nr:flagellar biosynthesis protein FlhB [Desulfovibrio sp. OttesenSCG-928-I05]
MAQKDPSKTEQATPKRINKSRKEGNVHKSQEVTKTAVIMAGMVGLYFWMNYIGRELSGIMRHYFSTAILTFNPTDSEVVAMFRNIAQQLAGMLLPFMFFIGLATYLVLRKQVGKNFTWKPLKPKLKKFNPINGIKRMFFSLGTFTRLLKSLALAICIGVAPWLVVKAEAPHFIDLYYTDAASLITYLLSMGWKMVMYALVPMTIIATVDYFYTKWDYGENLKMTKDEVKDERKQAEGDPRVKSQQRKKMMQMSMRRMMQEVPKADVVITNPTHFAVAIRYNTMEAPAPLVVAKGADKVAFRIREIARENGVPIQENKPLARALYSQVEIGDMIPEDLYQATAAVLAHVWKTKPRKNPVQNVARSK